MTVALLDTHAFVWALTQPERLGPAARRLVESPRTDVLVSAATAWELATKTRLGRFPSAEPIVAQYLALVNGIGARHRRRRLRRGDRLVAAVVSRTAPAYSQSLRLKKR